MPAVLVGHALEGRQQLIGVAVADERDARGAGGIRSELARDGPRVVELDEALLVGRPVDAGETWCGQDRVTESVPSQAASSTTAAPKHWRVSRSSWIARTPSV